MFRMGDDDDDEDLFSRKTRGPICSERRPMLRGALLIWPFAIHPLLVCFRPVLLLVKTEALPVATVAQPRGIPFCVLPCLTSEIDDDLRTVDKHANVETFFPFTAFVASNPSISFALSFTSGAQPVAKPHVTLIDDRWCPTRSPFPTVALTPDLLWRRGGAPRPCAPRPSGSD